MNYSVHTYDTELGSGRAPGAELAAGVSVLLGLCSCLFGCLVMFATLPSWVPLFTLDEDVIAIVKQAMPLVFLAVIG